MAENFGYFLKELLADLGITATQLAAMADRSERTIYNWLASENPPRDSLAVLSDVLFIPLHELRSVAAGEVPLSAHFRDRGRWKAEFARRPGADVRVDLSPFIQGRLHAAAERAGVTPDELLDRMIRDLAAAVDRPKKADDEEEEPPSTADVPKPRPKPPAIPGVTTGADLARRPRNAASQSDAARKKSDDKHEPKG